MTVFEDESPGGRLCVAKKIANADGESYDDNAIDQPFVPYGEATLITSFVGSPAISTQHAHFHNEAHMPVIDLDVPAFLVPSSDPGHSHLYIDRAMAWPDYRAMLQAMAIAGVVEVGYWKAAETAGYTAVRPPDHTKSYVPEGVGDILKENAVLKCENAALRRKMAYYEDEHAKAKKQVEWAVVDDTVAIDEPVF